MSSVQLRIVLIGTSSSGRRGLINALLGKSYDAQADDVGDYSFDDMCQATLNVKGTLVELNVFSPFWPGFTDNPDTTQRGFAALTYAYAAGFLVVYSIDDTSRYTFDEWIPKHIEFARFAKLNEHDLSQGNANGLQMVPEYDDAANSAFRRSFPFVVVATKRDKAESRTIGVDEGQRLADSLNSQYFEISTRLDDPQVSIGIFEHLVEKILLYRQKSSSTTGGALGSARRRSCCTLL